MNWEKKTRKTAFKRAFFIAAARGAGRPVSGRLRDKITKRIGSFPTLTMPVRNARPSCNDCFGW
jgi:hypothetical protein